MRIDLDGDEELHDMLSSMSKEFAGTQSTDMRSAMKRSMYRMVNTMADYPRPPGGSAYRRTGTLGRRWNDDVKIDARTGGVQGSIGNNTEYGPWVQSDRFQTAKHRRTGWITDQKALDKNENAIRGEFEDAIRRMMNK